MTRGHVVATVLAAAVLAVLAPPAVAQETLRLDSSVGTAPYAGPVTTSDPLEADTFYLARVRGTVSAFHASLWDDPTGYWVVCGDPEPSPDFPVTAPDVPAGMDAETIFATPAARGCGSFDPPVHTDQFEIDTGTGYSHPEPRDGPFTAPVSDHEYWWILRGADAPASFRLRDSFLGDNTGQLRIRVREARRSDCNNGGWVDFGYASREECRELVPEAP